MKKKLVRKDSVCLSFVSQYHSLFHGQPRKNRAFWKQSLIFISILEQKKSSAKCDLLKCYKSIVIVANYFNIIMNLDARSLHQFIVRLMRTFAAGFFIHLTVHNSANFVIYYTICVCIIKLMFLLCCDLHCVVRISFVLSSSGQKPLITIESQL